MLMRSRSHMGTTSRSIRRPPGCRRLFMRALHHPDAGGELHLEARNFSIWCSQHSEGNGQEWKRLTRKPQIDFILPRLSSAVTVCALGVLTLLAKRAMNLNCAAQTPIKAHTATLTVERGEFSCRTFQFFAH